MWQGWVRPFLNECTAEAWGIPSQTYRIKSDSFVSTEKTTEAKMMKAGGTEIGKTLAEKSRGLFSANDWQCKTFVFVLN